MNKRFNSSELRVKLFSIIFLLLNCFPLFSERIDMLISSDNRFLINRKHGGDTLEVIEISPFLNGEIPEEIRVSEIEVDPGRIIKIAHVPLVARAPVWGKLYYFDVSADSKKIAIISSSPFTHKNELRIHDLRTLKELVFIRNVHPDYVLFSKEPDVVFMAEGPVISEYNYKTKEVLNEWQIDGNVDMMAVSSNYKYLTAVSKIKGIVRVWDIEKNELLIESSRIRFNFYSNLFISPDGSSIAYAGYNTQDYSKKVFYINALSGDIIKEIPFSDDFALISERSVIFYGKTFVSSVIDGKIKSLDVQTSRYSVNKVVVASRDNKIVVAKGSYYDLHLIDGETATVIYKLDTTDKIWDKNKTGTVDPGTELGFPIAFPSFFTVDLLLCGGVYITEHYPGLTLGAGLGLDFFPVSFLGVGVDFMLSIIPYIYFLENDTVFGAAGADLNVGINLIYRMLEYDDEKELLRVALRGSYTNIDFANYKNPDGPRDNAESFCIGATVTVPIEQRGGIKPSLFLSIEFAPMGNPLFYLKVGMLGIFF